MRISLIKNGKIYNTDLPLKVSGSFWIEDKDKNNVKRNLVNIEAREGNWYIKSNFETKIVDGGQVIEEILVEEYRTYELQVKGEKFNYILCSMPVYDSSFVEYDVNDNSQIYIGNSSENIINYNNRYIAPKQCLLSVKNGVWHIKNLTNNGVIFVNKKVVSECNLNIGDLVFIMNLKIIICGSYILINSPKGMINCNFEVLKKRMPLNIQQIEDKMYQEEDMELTVYEKSDYFYRMPRFKTSVEEETVNIDSPPESEKQEEMPLAYTLGPMITMGITSMVSGVTSIGNVMSGTQSLQSALPSLITCVAMLLSMMVWPMLQKNIVLSKKRKEKH